MKPLPILLLPGWGFASSIWEPLLPYLSQYGETQCVELTYDCSDPDEVCEGLLSALPREFVVCGWSLGGMLAVRLAAKYPQRVKALLTFATNASFIAQEHWPRAMDADVFASFASKVSQNPRKGLQRFCQLVSHGNSRNESERLGKYLLKLSAEPLLQGLNLLKAMDNSSFLSLIRCPSIHFFGKNDALVPCRAADSIASCMGAANNVQVIANCGHLLHFPIEKIEPHLTTFLTRELGYCD